MGYRLFLGNVSAAEDITLDKWAQQTQQPQLSKLFVSSSGLRNLKPSSAFVPSSITGLRLWLQADNLVLSNDDPVSTWADLSSNSNDFTQSGLSRPVYKTNIQNGKPIVRFDGGDDFMEKATPTGLDGGTGLTLFLVAKHPGVASQVFLAKWDYQTQGSWAIQSEGTDNLKTYIANGITDVGDKTQASTDGGMTTAFYLIEMVYDGSQGTNANRVKHYKNGTLLSALTNGTLATSLTSCTATLKLGKWGGSLNRFFSSDIGEVLIYDSALSDGNRALVETYLNSRWALY